MKKEVINNKYYEKSSEFKLKILEFFENIKSYKNESLSEQEQILKQIVDIDQQINNLLALYARGRVKP